MSVHEFIDSAKNFYGDFSSSKNRFEKDISYSIRLYELYKSIQYDLCKKNEVDNIELLKNVYKRIYDFIIASDYEFKIYNKDQMVYQSVFDACLFTSLCMYINTTKRIKGLSLGKFVYKHSPRKFNVKGTINYFDLKNPPKASSTFKLYEDEEKNLRQSRYRLFSKKEKYYKRSEGSAISMDSEYEVSFMNDTQNLDDEGLIDVHKRLCNLHNEISELSKLPKDERYLAKKEYAKKKYLSKVNKINYENLIKLQEHILSKINENQHYYGINIYRFEKSLRLYNLTNEVNSLLRCKNKAEEDEILIKSTILNNIYFPKIYHNFSLVDNYFQMCNAACLFYPFLNNIVESSLLIFDKLVQEGYYGESWADFFCQTINQMLTNVFYDSKEIDFTVTPESQEKFLMIMIRQVRLID